MAVPGVSVANFLRAALSARRSEDVPVREFRKEMEAAFKELTIPREFMGPGMDYKAEVAAIEKKGNRTVSERRSRRGSRLM